MSSGSRIGTAIAGQHAVAIDPGPGDAIEPLGDVEPADLDSRRSALGDLEGLAPIAEVVLGELVAVTRDEEEHLAVEQAGLVEGDHAVTVGDVADLVDRLELDQRHAAARRLVDDLDAEDARAAGPAGQAGRGRRVRRPAREADDPGGADAAQRQASDDPQNRGANDSETACRVLLLGSSLPAIDRWSFVTIRRRFARLAHVSPDRVSGSDSISARSNSDSSISLRKRLGIVKTVGPRPRGMHSG